MINNYVLAIQAFVKVDTLSYLLQTIPSLIGIEKYTIIIGIDSCNKMRYKNRDHWPEQNKIVKDMVLNFRKSAPCKKVDIIENDTNMGTAPTCKKIVDHAMNFSDYTIFIEDDIILSKDALLYHEHVFELTKSNIDVFAISVGGIDLSRINTNIDNLYKLHKLNWVDSAEFGVNKNIWCKYGEIRGQTMGAINFGNACRTDNKYTISPIIKRMCRLGINHPDSYALYYHPKESIVSDFCQPISNMFEIDTINYKSLLHF